MDESTENDLITNLIQAAREQVEQYTNQSIVAQTWYAYADSFQEVFELSHSPVTSVTSVKYYDSEKVLQILAASNYDTDLVSEPARICRGYNVTYPESYVMPNAITIEFVCGYSSVPASIKAAMLLIIGHLYENRENVIVGHTVNELPQGAMALLNPYRVFVYG